MDKANAGWVAKSLAILAKDIRLELRSRYAVNSILMFGVTTLAVVSFSLGQSSLPPHLLGALFWIVMFFSAMSGLALSFVREEEAGTALALRLTAPPEPVLIGKLLFNFLLLLLMTVVITPLFFIFTDASLSHWVGFLVVLLLGVVGLCAATTLVAAIISRAAVKGTLFAVLSFPVLVPLLLILVRVTQKLFEGATLMELLPELQFLFAFAVVMVAGSVMLFRFVWKD
ncbi:MAG: heme exporter protein CcmB [candidate division Zixibacteria bacterium]|nr:heme exporter protein CcmB [candidate division Zixibacteria bacterium]